MKLAETAGRVTTALKLLGWLIVAGALLCGVASSGYATPALAAAAAGPGQVISDTPAQIVWNGWNAEFCEVFLITGTPPNLKATFYNTMGLNDAAHNDSCPADKWAALDPKAVAAQYHVESVFKNGPHAWVVDRLIAFKQGGYAGKVLDFAGIKGFFAGVVQLPPGTLQAKPGSGGYKPTTVRRQTEYQYFKGHPIFILDGPDGKPWIMQAYSRMVDPTLTLAQLSNLGSTLTLPPGWKFRTVTLDRNLTVHPVNGMARIVQDNLEATYDECFATACSWTP